MTPQNEFVAAAEDRIRDFAQSVESGQEDTDSYERLLAEKDLQNETL